MGIEGPGGQLQRIVTGKGYCLSKLLASDGVKGRAKMFRKLGRRILSIEGSNLDGKEANLKSKLWELQILYCESVSRVRRLRKEAVDTTHLDYSLHLLVTERRHGPLSKLYARAPPPPPAPASSQKCHVVNGQGPACRAPGSTKTSSREKGQGSRSRGHQPPEKTQKDNLW